MPLSVKFAGSCLLIVFVAGITFSGSAIRIEPESPGVLIDSWRWWGFSHKETPIVWRESEGWMAKDAKGEWYLAIYEEDPLAY